MGWAEKRLFHCSDSGPVQKSAQAPTPLRSRFGNNLSTRCIFEEPRAQVFAYLVAYFAEERQAFRFGALEGRGIFERVMKRDGSGKEWAVVFGVIANCEDVIELFALKLVHVLGTVGGNVDAQLAHDGDCFGANMAWVGSGAEDFELIARVVTEQTFGHLASC